VSSVSFYEWRTKYSSTDASVISRIKSPEDNNQDLKGVYANLSERVDLLKRRLEKNEAACSATIKMRVQRQSG
jgi:tRNA C32,U32 (ribose-2'-O)-methylase TrmJ